MSKKLLLAGVGVVLIVGSFFVGMKYRETPKDNTQNNVVKEDIAQDLNSLLSESNKYMVGESRTISPFKNVEGKIGLAFVYEVKTVMDETNHFQYRIYRVGQGDEPPTYSEGRIFLQVVDSATYPRYIWSMFDTQIDKVEPLGDVYIRGGKLIITCAKKQTIAPGEPCEYQVDYSKETHNLVVSRKI